LELSLDSIQELQKDLKRYSDKAYQKFKQRVIEKGFKYVFFVWIDKKTDKIYFIDGHHRKLFLKKMEDEGFKIPEKYYALPVEAENRKEAAIELLHLNSQYGEMTNEGLKDYLKSYNIKPVEITSVKIEPVNVSMVKTLRAIEKEELSKTKNDDEVPEDIIKISKQGDIWELNNHRLLCGDCTKKENIDKLLGDKTVEMLCTDPPYGVNYASKNDFFKDIHKGHHVKKEYANDDLKDYQGWFESWLDRIPFSSYNTIYIWINGKRLRELMNACYNKKITTSTILVWVKDNHVLGRMDYLPQHELCVYGWKVKHKFYAKNVTSILKHSKPLVNDLHPTMKPVELITELVLHGSKENDNVLELFCGSGTTIISCEKTNRKCFATEIDPYFCNIIVSRWIKWMNDNNKVIERLKLNGKDFNYKNNEKIRA